MPADSLVHIMLEILAAPPGARQVADSRSTWLGFPAFRAKSLFFLDLRRSFPIYRLDCFDI